MVVDDLKVGSEIEASFNSVLRFFLLAQGIHQLLRLRNREELREVQHARSIWSDEER